MKSSKEIKKEIHEYIDRIDDEETLWTLHEDVAEYLKKETPVENEEEDYLTNEQEKQLDEAIKQADKGEVMDFDEFKRRVSSWHIK